MILKGKTLSDQPEPHRPFKLQLNDGSDAAPRLLVGFSTWALVGLMDDATLDEQLARVSADGYDFVEGHWDDEAKAAEAGKLAASHNLRLIYQGWFSDPDEIDAALAMARSAGCLGMNAHVSDQYVDELTAARLVDGLTGKAESGGVPLMIETHRGCVTQDLVRALRWADRCTCRFNLDVSHWAVAGAWEDGPDEALRDRIRPLLSRVAMIHGRISNGQQVQVAVRDAGEEAVINYQKIWATAMGLWQRSAGPGDVFLFEPELGPPRYAMRDGAGREFSDRLDESRELVRLARNAWDAIEK